MTYSSHCNLGLHHHQPFGKKKKPLKLPIQYSSSRAIRSVHSFEASLEMRRYQLKIYLGNLNLDSLCFSIKDMVFWHVIKFKCLLIKHTYSCNSSLKLSLANVQVCCCYMLVGWEREKSDSKWVTRDLLPLGHTGFYFVLQSHITSTFDWLFSPSHPTGI